jgi:hypothetical protein
MSLNSQDAFGIICLTGFNIVAGIYAAEKNPFAIGFFAAETAIVLALASYVCYQRRQSQQVAGGAFAARLVGGSSTTAVSGDVEVGLVEPVASAPGGSNVAK